MKKAFLYECNQCDKNCQMIREEEVEDVEDTISGYDSHNDCDYYYILQGEYQEQKIGRVKENFEDDLPL